jgi:DNA repair exonuclease SbcCD ATPase subunit
MSLIFESVRWKNFLATGNQFIEIDLSKNPTTLIVGTNGVGKSTMLDAINFALFGTPFRAINKPQLVNSINEKDCVCEIVFKTSGRQYKVVRGIKPAIFEIHENGKVLPQNSAALDQQDHLEKNILRLNQKSFSQIVVLGTDFIPFMKLTALDRRTVIEDLLGIRIFTAMNVVLKEKISVNKSLTETNQTRQAILLEKKKLIEKYISEIQTNTQERLNTIETDIEVHQKQIEAHNADISNFNKAIKDLTSKTKRKKTVDKKISDAMSMDTGMVKSEAKLTKDIEFFENTEACPTCQQGIDAAFKESTISEKKKKLQLTKDAKLAVVQVLEELTKERDELEEIFDQISDFQVSISSHEGHISSIKKYISKLEMDRDSIKNSPPADKEQAEELNEVKAELDEAIAEKDKLSEELQSFNICATMLKDSGIKTQIIRQYLPIINKLVNKYLGDLEFFINFSLDETFKETIKSRYRDVFSYSSFSNGQKKRIDLALLFTWREIAKLKNSMNTNLLIFDEVTDGAMDNSGIDEFLKLIQGAGNNTNIFVISPKGDHLQDKFSNVIKFELKNGFTKIA